MQKLMLCACAALSLVAVGCGGSGTGVDGGAVGNDLAGAHFQSGTYTVSNLQVVGMDNCQKGIMNGAMLPIANTGGMITLGSACNTTTTDPMCSTSGNLEGSGGYNSGTTADVTFMTQETYADGCTYAYTAEAKFTFTGMNQASLELIFNETGIDPTKCTADEGALGGGTSCTSDFTMTVSM
jgi:hypothetical protein